MEAGLAAARKTSLIGRHPESISISETVMDDTTTRGRTGRRRPMKGAVRRPRAPRRQIPRGEEPTTTASFDDTDWPGHQGGRPSLQTVGRTAASEPRCGGRVRRRLAGSRDIEAGSGGGRIAGRRPRDTESRARPPARPFPPAARWIDPRRSPRSPPPATTAGDMPAVHRNGGRQPRRDGVRGRSLRRGAVRARPSSAAGRPGCRWPIPNKVVISAAPGRPASAATSLRYPPVGRR